jgi:hypothetical protein
MRSISRVVSTLGALLVIAGILGPIIGFDGGQIFPGIVLLFIGRALAKQATTAETKGEEPVTQRVLNTVRTRTMPPARGPAPPRRSPPPAAGSMTPPPVTTQPEPSAEPNEKQEMLETLLLAGSELTERKEAETGDTGDTGVEPRMSSAEMVMGKRVGGDAGDMGVEPRMSSAEMVMGKRVGGDAGDMGVEPRMSSAEMVMRKRVGGEAKPRMSSAEMISEARKRWGSRPGAGR